MDLELVETLNGGDLVKNAKDLKVIYGFEAMPYMAMFGGNTEESTPTIRLANRQYNDFWANDLLWPKNASLQINSETERVMSSVPLTSFGRLQIEQAIKKDLNFFRDVAEVKVAVTILSDDRIAIGIKLIQQVFVYIWDATNKELTDAEFIVTTTGTVRVKIFDYTFDFTFE